MKKIILLLFLFAGINIANAVYDWESLSYTHSSEKGPDNSRTYYIITIDKDGSGKLEFFKSGKVSMNEFRVSRKTLNHLNEVMEKKKIFDIDPKELNSDKPVTNENVYTMTITLGREYGEEHEDKFREQIREEHENDSEKENEKEEEKEKPMVIPVPANINPEFKKRFYDLYYEIEMAVPDRIWKDAGLSN